jgi:hypothetical protein
MAEEKKVEKPFVDAFSLMKTEELLSHYDKHYADTPEDAARREGYEHEKQSYMDLFQNVQNTYLINKRGKGTKGNTPKRFALDKKNVNIESSELINTILMTLLDEDTKNAKGESNKAILDLYKANPHMLREYARGKNIDYERLKQDLIDNYTNINKSKEFSRFKDTISSMLIKDMQKLQRVGTELYSNTQHHPKIKAHVNSKLQKAGYSLEETVDVQEQLQHYQNLLQNGGKMSADYAHQYGNSLKKYEDKPK